MPGVPIWATRASLPGASCGPKAFAAQRLTAGSLESSFSLKVHGPRCRGLRPLFMLESTRVRRIQSAASAEISRCCLSTHRKPVLSVLLCLGLAVGACYATTPPKSKTKHASASKSRASKSRRTRAVSRHRGQQAIDAARVREIQAALIRERFLDGQPSGIWDQRSKDAMQRFQQVNGWQTKMVPDSRALIKLGLGPDRANLINPNTAATAYIPGGGSSSPQR